MKNIAIVIVLAFGLSTSLKAQDSELKSAAANIEKKDYIAALDDINQAKKKVNNLMTEQLSSVLPAQFGEYKLEKDQEGGYGGDQGVSVNKTYRKPEPKKAEPSGEEKADDMALQHEPMIQNREYISVQITTNMMMANEVMNAHSMSESMGDRGGKAIRIKGYRALVRSFENEGAGGSDTQGRPSMGGREEAQAIVGAAFIRVETSGLAEKGQAEKFLDQIDFDKLKGIVGE